MVIPAHDEEANVGATVASCLDSSYDPSRFHVCVIADNCTDDTAFQAARGRRRGLRADRRRPAQQGLRARRLPRDPKIREPGRSGQGHGYDFDAAIVIDADTVIDPLLLASIAPGMGEGSDWVQCYYTVRTPTPRGGRGS